MQGSMLAESSAFAPAARRQRTETSDGKKPKAGPMRVTWCRRVVVIIEGVMLTFVLLLLYIVASGVEFATLCWRR